MSSKNVLNKNIVKEFIERCHFKSDKSVENFISKIKTNEGLDCSQNAVAQVAAKIKGFSIAHRLKKEDKVPNNLAEIVGKYSKKFKGSPTQMEYKKDFSKKAVKSQSPLEKEAWENARCYPPLYILENKLRILIFTRMGRDELWWKKPSINQKIEEYAKNMKQNNESTPWIKKQGDHPMYYITLSHLSKLIELNWNSFKKLKNLHKFLSWLDDLIIIRNSLAHNAPLSNRDKKEIEVQVPKILSVLKKEYNI